MNKLDQAANFSNISLIEQRETLPQQESTLRSAVEKSLRRFFQNLEDEPVSDLHQMVMSEVEAPLLEAVMRYTGNNQSKASIMLGLNRGTLRTKLKNYGML
jgi:Fis family transcriptional regulator